MLSFLPRWDFWKCEFDTDVKKEHYYHHDGKKLGFKGALSDLRQFLETERPLKMMNNAFYFTSKAVYVLKTFKFLSWLSDHVSKLID